MRIRDNALINVDNSDIINGTIEIPENVTMIYGSAFLNCTNLVRLRIPAGVKKIGADAFANCTNLEEVNIPEVYKIKNGTFRNCIKLKNIMLPESVEIIEEFAFSNCESLIDINFPSKLVKIGDHAFNSCVSLQNVIIPAGVAKIDRKVFSDCTNLQTVKLPAGIKAIYGWAFNNCIKLNTINFPDSLISIGDNAFENCASLQVAELPPSIEVLGRHSFRLCKSIIYFAFPRNIKLVEENFFEGCVSLQQVVLPVGMKGIANSAFYNCSSLTNINLPKTIKIIKQLAFSGCSSLNKIDLPPINCVSYGMFKNCLALKDITLPDTVTIIEEQSFVGAGLEKITIPANVVVYPEAFKNCLSLKQIEISSLSRLYNYSSDDLLGVTSVIINYPNSKIHIKVDGVKEIKSLFDTTNSFLINGNLYFEYLDKCYKMTPLEMENIKSSWTNKGYDDAEIKDMSRVKIWQLKNRFLPHFSVVKNLPISYIDNFYINNNYKKWGDLIERLNIQLAVNKGTFIKLCFVLGLFEQDQKTSNSAYEYLANNLAGKIDENTIHECFDGFNLNTGFKPEYSKFFQKFFDPLEPSKFLDLDNMGETEYSFSYLAASFNRFDEIKKIYPNKIINSNRTADALLPEHVIKALRSFIYKKINHGNDYMAALVSQYGYSQSDFEKLQTIFEKAKLLEPEKITLVTKPDDKKQPIHYDLLEKNNPVGLVLGDITNCCQHLNGAGESCMLYGVQAPNSKFLVIRYNNSIIAQGWVWYDEKTATVCIDNIEIPKTQRKKFDKDVNNQVLKTLKRFADNTALEMQELRDIKIKKVTIGLGYNDFKKELSDNFDCDKDTKVLSGYHGYTDARSQLVIYKACEMNNEKTL
ncbi:MAG: leucine-rich repeat domain-containing protein [Clostridia bacterium]|nr:leucine-rich repeat domain-containing protein [Clostridia bacterium]